jgi:hypothetical protein
MRRDHHWWQAVLMVGTLASCGVGDRTGAEPNAMGSALGATMQLDHRPAPSFPLVLPCEQMAASLAYPNTTFASAVAVAAGVLKQADRDIPAHCQLTGEMFHRVGSIDGQTYAIGFEMRLPLDWNGRFFYQANGGLDGVVVPATGSGSGGGALTGALLQGSVVISSDAGHNASQNPTFGVDPQARLDYGYQAVGKLTPMAKSVLRSAYGRGPVYSYIGGCSNGGRHTMVAAARYADEYDGYLVGSPGFHLPSAAVSSIYGAQQYAPFAVPGAVYTEGPFAGLPDISGAFTQAERQLVSDKVLERCDALDGVVDGLVQRTTVCQRVFDLVRDVPTCAGARDGTCLAADQKQAIARVFSGGTTSTGLPIYSRFPFDSGHASSGTAFWDFVSPVILDAGAVGFVFGTPPADPATFVPPLFALTGSVDQMLASTYVTTSTYREPSQSFMVPPRVNKLNGLRHGGKRMVVYHGVSDPIFSPEDTIRWFETFRQARSQDTVRLFLVPGMNHCSGGPATDQFDLLTPLMQWVEQDEAPAEVVASARGASNPGGANPEVPASWSSDRTRPLCPFPRVAEYKGGDIESADSFACR